MFIISYLGGSVSWISVECLQWKHWLLELVMLSEDTDDFSIKWMKTVEGDRKGVWLMEKRGAPSPPTHPHPFSPVQNDQATPRQGLHNFPPVMQTIFIVLGNPGLLSCPATFSIFMNLTENDIYWLWQCPPLLDDLNLTYTWFCGIIKTMTGVAI